MLQRFISKKSERNIGLEILRMLLCFWVVLFHCVNYSESIILKNFLEKKFHVPCFFFISFYYFYPIIRDRNSYKMKIRLERLFVPYIIWPFFIWCFNNLLYLHTKRNRFGRMLTFRELKLQLITGRVFFIQLWFLFNLLFLSIFFFIISFLNGNTFFIFINFICILCILIQYLSYNYYFSRFKDCIAHSVGHFVISFPLAVTAFCLNKINLIQYFENNGNKYLLFLLIIIVLLFVYGAPNTYYGIDKNLFSLITFYLFHLIPLNKYLSKNLKNIIYLMTNYTNGIYCLHIIIKFYFIRLFKIKPTFLCCYGLYFFCYIISFFGEKAFHKNKLKYLFI
jgi:fucose 4-O-acetylase-like acetyltransferase